MDTRLPVRKIQTVVLGGWPHIALSRREFAELMVRDCQEARKKNPSVLPKLAFSMNGEALSLTRTNKQFREAMQQSDYIQADGQSLVFASKLLSPASLPERIATTDFFHDAAKAACEADLSFYILGAREEELFRAVEEIKRLYPNLKIVGYRDGYFSAEQEEHVCIEIVASGADVLWVGMGKPKEQLFCIRNRERLRGVGWIKTCGGLFDFLAGKNPRAPKWMQKCGLEWLHRLAMDPKRLFWRYLTTNLHAILLLLIGTGHCDKSDNSSEGG